MLYPERLGRYLLVKKLATGGMAEIFLAKLKGAEGFEKEVVLKRILPQWSQDREFIAMLIDEAKISVQLTHPHIIQVYEFVREGETYYLAMEYIHGVDLRRLSKKVAFLKKKIPIDVGLIILCDVLEGLAYAHTKKVVHRDISPQNILVSFDGAVKITDFGIAKAASRSHETVAGVLKGKIAYMSPEQANQEGLDGRSDLFSAAIVLYEMLTGERLFYRNSDMETLDRVRRGQVNFSPQAEKSLPQKLKEILLKALARDPAERYASALEFRDALSSFARRSKKNLHREKVAAYLQSLYAEEIKVMEEETTGAFVDNTGTAGLLRDATELTEKEVLVRRSEESAEGGTVYLPSSFALSSPTRTPVFRIGLVAAFLITVVTVAVLLKRPTVVSSSSGVLPAPPSLKETPVPPEVILVEPIAVLSPQVFPETVATALPAATPSPLVPQQKQDETSGSAYLSVQAIPWGYVSIDGGGRRETPLRKTSLKTGKHSLRVLYEPDGRTVATSIRLKAGENMVCVADFRGEKTIRCGN